MKRLRHFRRRRELGATVLEFALVAIPLIVLLLAIVQFGLALFNLSAAAEATRLGARLGVVHGVNSPVPVNAMRGVMVFSAGCSMNIDIIPIIVDGVARPGYVRASVSDCPVQPWFLPFVPPFQVPAFTTTLPRESLGENG